MALINLKKNEIQAKIVYYGPGRGGKTTNLEYISKRSPKHIISNIVTLNTREGHTLFFDYLPFDIGEINGYKFKVQLYTVPGQLKYRATRRVLLRGADGIVFVADAMAVRRVENIISLQNLREDLAHYKKRIEQIPFVIQYNKMDLLEKGIPLLPTEALDKDLNRIPKTPSFVASATQGKNVLATLKKIIVTTVASIKKDLDSAEISQNRCLKSEVANI
ncbi:MAG: GTPase domain-containing protein [Deltaproteobacteria bacterium]|jgi:small GTP-binding protein|nr:GTPase domain-containing protein [Deltaproteobacteria bacterium]